MPVPVHLYQRGAVWWCNFTVAGQHYRRSTGKRDQGEAQEAAAAIYLEECRRARVAVPDGADLDLTDVAAQYLADLQERLDDKVLQRGPRYYDNEESAIEHVLRRFTSAGAITTDTWNLAREKMRAAKTSSRSIQRITVACRHLLSFARKIGAIVNEPKLEAPKGEDVAKEQRETRPMKPRERDRFLAAVKERDRRAWRIYLVLFYSGLRKSELERLRVRDVDLRGGWVHLQPRRTKSGKVGQEMGLHPKAAATIRAEMRTRKVINPSEPIFGAFDYDRLFWSVVAELGLDEYGLTAHHVTRRTLATEVGDKGASVAEMLATFRWTTPQMAMRYQKINARRSKTALARVR